MLLLNIEEDIIDKQRHKLIVLRKTAYLSMLSRQLQFTCTHVLAMSTLRFARSLIAGYVSIFQQCKKVVYGCAL